MVAYGYAGVNWGMTTPGFCKGAAKKEVDSPREMVSYVNAFA